MLSLLHLYLLLWCFIPSPNTIAADITRYLTHHSPPTFNDFILTPKSINLARNEAVEVEEFKLYDKYYIRYNALIRGLKYMKQRTLYI